MPEEIEDAYNEWLITFGYRAVKYHELYDSMWGMFDLLRHNHLKYKYDEELDEASRQLKQPHEITAMCATAHKNT